jgi:hypothetical protein
LSFFILKWQIILLKATTKSQDETSRGGKHTKKRRRAGSSLTQATTPPSQNRTCTNAGQITQKLQPAKQNNKKYKHSRHISNWN